MLAPPQRMSKAPVCLLESKPRAQTQEIAAAMISTVSAPLLMPKCWLCPPPAHSTSTFPHLCWLHSSSLLPLFSNSFLTILQVYSTWSSFLILYLVWYLSFHVFISTAHLAFSPPSKLSSEMKRNLPSGEGLIWPGTTDQLPYCSPPSYSTVAHFCFVWLNQTTSTALCFIICAKSTSAQILFVFWLTVYPLLTEILTAHCSKLPLTTELLI